MIQFTEVGEAPTYPVSPERIVWVPMVVTSQSVVLDAGCFEAFWRQVDLVAAFVVVSRAYPMNALEDVRVRVRSIEQMCQRSWYGTVR